MQHTQNLLFFALKQNKKCDLSTRQRRIKTDVFQR